LFIIVKYPRLADASAAEEDYFPLLLVVEEKVERPKNGLLIEEIRVRVCFVEINVAVPQLNSLETSSHIKEIKSTRFTSSIDEITVCTNGSSDSSLSLSHT